MVFKVCCTLWMLHPQNFALNMCLIYADSSVLIDLKRKKKSHSGNYVWEVLILSIIFRLKRLISQSQWCLGQGCVSLSLYKILHSILNANIVGLIIECKQTDKFSNHPFCKLRQVSQK